MTPITLIQLIRDIFYTLNLAIVWQTAGERRPALDILDLTILQGSFPIVVFLTSYLIMSLNITPDPQAEALWSFQSWTLD